MLPLLRRFIDGIVQLGGWALLASALLVTYDVITRKLFNISIAGADEISGYVFAVSTAFAFSYALLARANIRIDLLYNFMPPKVKRLLDAISMVMTAGFLCVVTYYAYDLASDAITYDSRSITPLQTPLAIPQVAWVVGLGMAVFTSVVLLIAGIRAILRGDLQEAEGVMGIPSLSEEIESEIGGDDANAKGSA